MMPLSSHGPVCQPVESCYWCNDDSPHLPGHCNTDSPVFPTHRRQSHAVDAGTEGGPHSPMVLRTGHRFLSSCCCNVCIRMEIKEYIFFSVSITFTCAVSNLMFDSGMFCDSAAGLGQVKEE